MVSESQIKVRGFMPKVVQTATSEMNLKYFNVIYLQSRE